MAAKSITIEDCDINKAGRWVTSQVYLEKNGTRRNVYHLQVENRGLKANFPSSYEARHGRTQYEE